ncbi:L-alanine exporter AlaE, partial [Escherichia coli]
MLSPATHWRSAAADTFALVVYCFIAGMAIEVLISGMSFQQSLSSRLLSIPVNILIAWPYGRYR